jgi:hypothetical protein
MQKNGACLHPVLGNHKNANGLAKFLFVTVTTTALLALVGRNLPALSFLSARHIGSPLRVKHKIRCQNREKYGDFVKGVGAKTPKMPQKRRFLVMEAPGGEPVLVHCCLVR